MEYIKFTKAPRKSGKNAQFKKYLFGCALNNYSIAYWELKSGEIVLKLEKGTSAVPVDSVLFKDKDEFETWLDTHISDQDRHYNKARALYECLKKLWPWVFSEEVEIED